MTGDTTEITTVTSNRVTTPPTLLAKRVCPAAPPCSMRNCRQFLFDAKEPNFYNLFSFGDFYYALP